MGNYKCEKILSKDIRGLESKNCKPQNQAINTPQVIPHTIEMINLEIPRPEDAAESINHTVRPLP